MDIMVAICTNLWLKSNARTLRNCARGYFQHLKIQIVQETAAKKKITWKGYS